MIDNLIDKNTMWRKIKEYSKILLKKADDGRFKYPSIGPERLREFADKILAESILAKIECGCDKCLSQEYEDNCKVLSARLKKIGDYLEGRFKRYHTAIYEDLRGYIEYKAIDDESYKIRQSFLNKKITAAELIQLLSPLEKKKKELIKRTDQRISELEMNKKLEIKIKPENLQNKAVN